SIARCSASMPGARSTTSCVLIWTLTSAMRGSSRWLRNSFASSTTIQARSRSRPVSVSAASLSSTPAQDFTGYTKSRAMRVRTSGSPLVMAADCARLLQLRVRCRNMALDVCIRGAGIVGRTLALLLARERLRVGLVRGPATTAGAGSDVRAYALNAASKEMLELVRGWPDEAHATAVCRMEVHGDAGGELHFRAEDQGVPALAWIVDVGALLARLEDALKFAPQVTFLDAPEAAAL